MPEGDDLISTVLEGVLTYNNVRLDFSCTFFKMTYSELISLIFLFQVSCVQNIKTEV